MRSNKDLIQSKSKFPTCQEHDLELEYYCETCEKLVCVQCTGEHKLSEDHKYDVVKKFANKYQSELNKITGPIEVMMEDLSKACESIEEAKTAIREQGYKIYEEIDLYYDEMIEKLLKQKEKIKQQVHDTVLQKEKALTEQLEEVVCIQADILNLKRVRESLQLRSDQEVLSIKNELVHSLVILTENFNQLGDEPIESANIQVTPVNGPLPQVLEYFTTIDSLSFEVKCFKNLVQRGQMAMLELVAKDYIGNYYPKGGCKVTVQFQSSRGEIIDAKVTDYNDGTYMIWFSAQQVGEIELSVFVNGHEIKDSPLNITVQENPIKPNKIIINCDNNFGQLWGIACSNNGMWAVADWINNCVHVFDCQDNLIKKVGSQGSKNGQFIRPFGVAFDDINNLYVTDSYNHRVQKFNTHGNYVLQFGGKGTGTGRLNYPIGITTYQDKLYVADRENFRISVFQNDHGIIGQKKLSQHFDVTVNINGEILVADWGHHCIYTFSLDGHYINSITLYKGTERLELKSSCSITTDLNGFILIADTSMHA